MNSTTNNKAANASQQPNKAMPKKKKSRSKQSKLNRASGPPQQPYPQPSYSNTGMRALRKVAVRKRLTPGGEAFLKCAFAPPDFAASSPTGVPDEFQGASLLKKHRYVGIITCNAANRDYYILITPSAGGIAFWITNVLATAGITSATSFTPVYYSDAGTLFPGASGMCDNFTKYRYVSSHVELIPTMNAMSWAGSIQAWKLPITMVTRPGPGGLGANDIFTVAGLQGINASNANQYTGPVNLGVYAAAYNSGTGFDFQTITEGISALPLSINAGDFGQLNGAIGGIDSNFESIIVKITGNGPIVTNSFVIKTWACVEYLVNPGSGLYEYQTLCPKDDYAMELYRAIILQLPVGVSFLENEGFWSRVLKIIQSVSGGLSFVPGPYGMMASGVNTVANGIESLLL